jgi:hypothetical protein
VIAGCKPSKKLKLKIKIKKGALIAVELLILFTRGI